MKSKLFKNLLLFSLFGISLGFFGMLYEGVVYAPKMLDVSAKGMQFWHNFYEVIKPLIFYVPCQLGTIVLLVLFFQTGKQKTELKKQLKWASLFQIATLALTFYIVKQINLQLCFSDVEKYANAIPDKVILLNIISPFRVIFAGTAMNFLLKAFVQTQKESNH